MATKMIKGTVVVNEAPREAPNLLSDLAPKLQALLPAHSLLQPLSIQPGSPVWVPSGPPGGDFKFLLLSLLLLFVFKVSLGLPCLTLAHAA